MSFSSMLLTFLIYLSMVLRSDIDATLLVVIISPQWSMRTKSAKVSDLMFFSALLMLAMLSSEDSMNFEEFSLLIGMITCLLDGPLVVILMRGFSFLGSSIDLWISSIFLEESSGKDSLILRISLTLVEDTCVYDLLLLLLFLFSVGFVFLF